MDTFCPNPKSIYKNFTKKLQKNCKKIAKKLQKNCKKVAKKLQINLQNFCRFFAEFLQLPILQKVLHFRPREESVSVANKLIFVNFSCKKQLFEEILSLLTEKIKTNENIYSQHCTNLFTLKN